LEKAIEIKRRAQRCIQSGDLGGALAEYEKLVAAEDSDPYNFVLLADLLFKRGDTANAVQRYRSAADAYERSGLYKNAIAVCKKMARLSLAPGLVLERLGHLHALDGLATEAASYFGLYAEHVVRENNLAGAAAALRRAFECVPDDPRVLERLAELHSIEGDTAASAHALAEAALHYRRLGLEEAARRCALVAEQRAPGMVAEVAAGPASAEQIELQSPEPPAELDAAPATYEIWGEDEAESGPPSLGAVARGRAAADAAPGPPPLPGQEAAARLERFPGGRGTEVGLEFSPPTLQTRPHEAAPERNAGSSGQAEIERLLAEAQERLRNGDPEGGGDLLVDAARAYESAGRLDSAASIYRSLHRGPHAPLALMSLWFQNCERRGDRREAAQVACELGDRALQLGDFEGAREWFERARAHDQANPMARRRLVRLAELLSDGGVATGESASSPELPELAGPALMAPESQPPALEPAAEVPAFPYHAPEREPLESPLETEPPVGPEGGMADRIEMALGRSEAVTFDLGSLLSEFQRGIEAQLSGDAQSHYDLAMAYREMGLLEPAVESFRVAATDPGFVQRAAEMIGRCLLDQGRFDEAAQEFSTALELESGGAATNLDLRYQLGLALEAGGKLRDAAAQFEQVRAAQPTYRDVAAKLRALGKAAEGV